MRVFVELYSRAVLLVRLWYACELFWPLSTTCSRLHAFTNLKDLVTPRIGHF